jgi:hypothetical protein
MTRGEKCWMAAAILMIAWGSFMLLGAGINILEPTPGRHGVGANLLLALFIGLAPIGVGLWLAQRTRRAAATRRTAAREQTILQLAERHHGALTAVEVATHGRMTLEEATRLLNQLNLKGFNDMHVSEGGIIIYTFRA